jgi:hypothetical protein
VIKIKCVRVWKEFRLGFVALIKDCPVVPVSSPKCVSESRVASSFRPDIAPAMPSFSHVLLVPQVIFCLQARPIRTCASNSG